MITANDIEPEFIDAEEQQFIGDLINACLLSEDEKSNLSNELANGITRERADEVKEILYKALPNPVTHGSRFTVTQITKHLKKICQLK